MNNVTLQGVLMRNPELKVSANGKYKYTGFILAVEREENRKGMDYIPCKAWGKTAEIISQQGKKDSMLLISKGRIGSNRYEDKEGKKHYSIEVTIEEGSFLRGQNLEAKSTTLRDTPIPF